MGIGVFEHLKELFPSILRSIPIGLLIDTVRRLDAPTYFRHFKGFRPQSLGRNRVTTALIKEVYDRKNAAVADLINLLWNQSNRDLYKAMHNLVREVNEKVEEIESIDDQKANEIIDTLLKDFSRENIYLCVRMNEVKFNEKVVQTRLIDENDDWKPAEEPKEAVDASTEEKVADTKEEKAVEAEKPRTEEPADQPAE